MSYRVRAVVDKHNYQNQILRLVTGYQISIDGGPYEDMPPDRFREWAAEQELALLEARKEKARKNLAEARKLRKDVDRLIEQLENRL